MLVFLPGHEGMDAEELAAAHERLDLITSADADERLAGQQLSAMSFDRRNCDG